MNKKFFALLEMIELDFFSNKIEDDTHDEKSWREGGLVGIKVGEKRERERIIAIFNELNTKPMSKQEFTDKFTDLVNND